MGKNISKKTKFLKNFIDSKANYTYERKFGYF